jgi:hypothetical protein
MKNIILLFCFFDCIHAFAQPAGKKYTFPEIGWSIVLPEDFAAFPSSDQSIQIQPGGKAGNKALSKRLITAMKDANTFVVSLSSCDPRDSEVNLMRCCRTQDSTGDRPLSTQYPNNTKIH